MSSKMLHATFAAVVAALMTFGVAGTASATAVTGTVYCDANQNQEIDGEDAILVSVEVIAESAELGSFSDQTNFQGIYFIDLPNVVPASYDETLNPASLPEDAVIIGPATQSFDLTPTMQGAVVDWLVDAPICHAPFCGDGILDEGEQCDDGNDEDGDGCSAECTDEVSGGGCTPGYWKQEQHFDSYPPGVTPDTLFSDIFEDAFPGLTLLDVMELGGGGLAALGRHVAAAFLNASTIDYSLGVDAVVDGFNAVFPGSKGDYNTQKDVLEMFNELGCPLD